VQINIKIPHFLFLPKSTIYCGSMRPRKSCDSCLEVSKIKVLKMLDLQNKSAHFVWIELKDSLQIASSDANVNI